MLRLLRYIPVFLIMSCAAIMAQNTYTATVVDSDTTVWANAGCTVTIVRPPNYSGPLSVGSYTLTSADTTKSCTLNSSGQMSVVLYPNTGTGSITPSGTQWSFAFSPMASVPTQTFRLSLGATTAISSAINSNIKAPRFSAQGATPVFGMADVEVNTPVLIGAQYYDVTVNQSKVWNGTIWTNNASALGNGTIYTCGAGTGVTSCTVYDNYADALANVNPGCSSECNANYGTLKIIGGTGTTGLIAGLGFVNVLIPSQCDLIEQGNTAIHGLYYSKTSAGVYANLTVLGATIYINYVCHP